MTPLQALLMAGHAAVGWALCGAVMGVGLKTMSQRAALIVHGVAAPAIFVVVSAVYFSRFAYTGAFATAAAFVAVIIFLDVVVVCMMIRKTFDMFRSIPGTWLPLALIFLATWLTGRYFAA